MTRPDFKEIGTENGYPLSRAIESASTPGGFLVRFAAAERPWVSLPPEGGKGAIKTALAALGWEIVDDLGAPYLGVLPELEPDSFSLIVRRRKTGGE